MYYSRCLLISRGCDPSIDCLLRVHSPRHVLYPALPKQTVALREAQNNSNHTNAHAIIRPTICAAEGLHICAQRCGRLLAACGPQVAATTHVNKINTTGGGRHRQHADDNEATGAPRPRKTQRADEGGMVVGASCRTHAACASFRRLHKFSSRGRGCLCGERVKALQGFMAPQRVP